ncbi:MAG: hypothetical protein ACHQD8_07395, partial [Chitinophagales bacterium]
LMLVYMFTINNWVVIVLQNMLSVFNIYYSRKILLRIGYEKTYDWFLMLFIMAYPAQFINANTIAPDILLQTFTLLYIGNFISLFQKKQLKYAIYMSLSLAAGLFVKPVLYPFAIAHVFIVIATAARHKMLLQRIVLVAIFPLCAVLAYNYWNYTRTDKFHFSSNQAFNAVFYFHSFFSSRYGTDSAQHFLQNERKNIAAIPDYKDRYDYANERGVELLKQNFVPYMLYHLKHSARILIEPGKGELDLFTGQLTYGNLYHGAQTGFYATLKNKGWSGMREYLRSNQSMPIVIFVLLINCIRLIGLIIFFINKRIHWLIRLFTFTIIAYFAVAAGPIANTRYFLPVSLLVIGCAVMGYSEIINRRTNKLSAG